MRKATFNTTLASLIKYTSRVCRRSMGCTVNEAEQQLYALFDNSPSLEDTVKILRGAPGFENMSAVCELSAKIAAPKEIYSRKNMGETDTCANAPLYSVFDKLNTTDGQKIADSVLQFDSTKNKFIRTTLDQFEGIDYIGKWNKLKDEIISFVNENAAIEKYLRVICDLCCDVPLADSPDLKCDLSIYDHARLSAAFAGALTEYIEENGNSGSIRSDNAVLLYSADFTGIQSFIYTVSNSNVLKMLRARSFFVELFMENLIDEILDISGLSRANLLYSGGGHCYIILPNTAKCLENLKLLHKKINIWVAKAFGNSMSIVWDVRQCSANDFLDEPKGSYTKVFTDLSSKLAVRKLQKYTPDEILTLNSEITDEENRECSICGRSSALVKKDDNSRQCEWCSFFSRMSNIIMDEDMYFAVIKEKTDFGQNKFFSMNGNSYLAFLDENSAHNEYSSGNIKRIYCKNRYGSMSRYNESRLIHVCDYQENKILDDLAKSSEGIKRLGVLRMDVDNLGKTFVSGFRVKNRSGDGFCKDKSYVSIARTAALSYQLSIFFKQSIKGIFFEHKFSDKNYSVNVIYAGGDDVFLVGAWNDVIFASQDITAELAYLSGGKLTASAGIGIYDSQYPIAAYAVETESLESCAKNNPGKASVTLFEASKSSTYSWKVFSEKVQKEKLSVLSNYIHIEDNQKGMSFVYNLLNYLRGCKDDKINIARIAYLLGRMCSEKGLINKSDTKAFSGKIYDWVTNDTDRQQLITAICIFVYSERKDT